MQMDHRPSPRPRRIGGFSDLLHGGRVEPRDVDEIADKLWFDREGNRDPYVRFTVLLVLSVVIATGGVLSDSTATVIGAMIVAPLMTPIMGTALAIVVGDGVRLTRSLAVATAGAAAAIGVSYLLALASSLVVDASTNAQVSGRITPSTVDLVIALASGGAGAFALSRRNVSDSLPGVAIAISLVPPLCVAGVMLANHDPSASAGAMLLFLTNFLAILVAGGGLLAIMGYGSEARAQPGRDRTKATIVVAVATIAVLVPLVITGRTIASNAAIEYAIRSRASSVLGDGPTQLSNVHASGKLVNVTLEGPAEEGASIAQEVARRIHEARPDLDVFVYLLDTQVVTIEGT